MRCFFCVILLVFACGLKAQQSFVLQGTVRDSASLLYIALVKVSALDSAFNLRDTTHTDLNGLYRFKALPPGQYHLIFSCEGCRTDTVQHILSANQMHLDKKMSPGYLDIPEPVLIPANSSESSIMSNKAARAWRKKNRPKKQ